MDRIVLFFSAALLFLNGVSGQEPKDNVSAGGPAEIAIDTLCLDFDTFLVTIDTSYFIPGDDDYNLILAAAEGDLYATDLLVSRGADVNARSSEDVTPLMYASQYGYPEIVRYLLQHGANVDVVPDNGMTALISVSKTGDYEVFEMLLDSGAQVDATDYNGLSPLMYASAYNHPGIIALCLDRGADLNQRDWYGNSPLIMASYFGNYEAVRELLDQGAEINSSDSQGFTSLHIACQHGDYDLAWLLVDRGAELNTLNEGRITPLALAVQNGHQDVAELLLESGADINKRLNGVGNVLDIARKSNDQGMITFLIENGAEENRSPGLSHVFLSTGLDFNEDDFITGAALGAGEGQSGLNLQAGFMFRPAAIRVLDVEHELYASQYWERRYFLYLGLDRNLRINRNGTRQYGFVPGVCIAHSWSRYRGSDARPETLLAVVPRAGLYWRSGFFQMDIAYEYLDYKQYQMSPHRINIGLRFYIEMTEDKYKRKELPTF